MLIDVDFHDLTILLRGFGCDYKEAEIVADYIEESGLDEITIRKWVANVDYICFDNKEECLQHIKEEGLNVEDCTIYDGQFGCYFEAE